MSDKPATGEWTELPRHDDLENPPEYSTLRDDYWQLYDTHNAALAATTGEWTRDSVEKVCRYVGITYLSADRIKDAHNEQFKEYVAYIDGIQRGADFIREQLAAAVGALKQSRNLIVKNCNRYNETAPALQVIDTTLATLTNDRK